MRLHFRGRVVLSSATRGLEVNAGPYHGSWNSQFRVILAEPREASSLHSRKFSLTIHKFSQPTPELAGEARGYGLRHQAGSSRIEMDGS